MEVIVKIRTAFLPSLLLASVLFLSFFGIFFCTKMMMSAGSTGMAMTSDCTGAMGSTSNCPMDIATHLNAWSHLLEVVLNSSLLGLLFVSLLVCVSALATILKAEDCDSAFQFYLKNHQRYKLYNYFVELFSRGILQPKLLA